MRDMDIAAGAFGLLLTEQGTKKIRYKCEVCDVYLEKKWIGAKCPKCGFHYIALSGLYEAGSFEVVEE